MKRQYLAGQMGGGNNAPSLGGRGSTPLQFNGYGMLLSVNASSSKLYYRSITINITTIKR